MKLRLALVVLAIGLASAGCSSKPKGDVGGNNTVRQSDLARPEPGKTWQEYTERSKNGYNDRVFFAYDRYDLDEEAQATIRAWSEWLRAHRDASILVEGHADERGTREYNLGLGARRATAMRDRLIALGVNARRIRTISYGKERPAVAGDDERAYQQNRRGVARPSIGGA